MVHLRNGTRLRIQKKTRNFLLFQHCSSSWPSNKIKHTIRWSCLLGLLDFPLSNTQRTIDYRLTSSLEPQFVRINKWKRPAGATQLQAAGQWRPASLFSCCWVGSSRKWNGNTDQEAAKQKSNRGKWQISRAAAHHRRPFANRLRLRRKGLSDSPPRRLPCIKLSMRASTEWGFEHSSARHFALKRHRHFEKTGHLLVLVIF